MPALVDTYHLPPTTLIPNSPYPLLHYPGFLIAHSQPQPQTSPSPSPSPNIATQAHDLFTLNSWQTQWILRYAPTQASHYHSQTHECMAVLSGSATIRFGVGDTSPDLAESTWGEGFESGGVEVRAGRGDVFVVPAGVAHKTFDPRGEIEGKGEEVREAGLLTPGDGHGLGVAAEDVRGVLGEVVLEGFTMVGAYPEGCGWDSCTGGEEVERERVWSVRKPERDPVLGVSGEGMCGLWR